MNRRFVGAWGLVSFESRKASGEIVYPWGHDPVGIVIWDESGHMSAQLGPRDPEPGQYVAYFGALEADDVVEGTLVHRVQGASAVRLRTDQVRQFRFVGSDQLFLSPPPAPDGTVSILGWRKLIPAE